MRIPLKFKVSFWLLLNLLLLAALAGFAVFRAGDGITWDSLVAGDLGRPVQAWAELTVSDLRSRPRSEWNDALANATTIKGVSLAYYGEDLRRLAGDDRKLPSLLRDWLTTVSRAQEIRPRGIPPDRSGPEGFGFPPRAGLDEGPPPHRGPEAARSADGGLSPGSRPPQRVLVPSASESGYWVGVMLGLPGRSRDYFLVHVPSLWVLLDVLELKNALWLAGGAVVLSVLIWLPFVSGVTRALGRLTLATERIADGRFDTRVPGERHDEIGELGVAINRMSSRLELLVGGQKRFLGDIAHELGSPLGRMQLGVGILEERVPSELRPAVADVREEVAHMADLVAELLAFTRAGLLPRAATQVRVELSPLVARVLGREAAADAVALDLPAGLAVRADADLLARAIGNLLRNALRYAGRDAAITLRAYRVDTSVELVVDDTGPGVPPEALARLGEPFFRPEIARQRETGGAGLGLAIVRACVEACGGGVHFANRDPRGFRASIRLPLAD